MKLNKEYWENRYLNNEAGWDTGAVTTPIKTYIDQLTDKSIKILIPGAGNGYEFEYLISQGFDNVFVVDFAASPLNNIKKRMPSINDNQLIKADFFDIEGVYDLVIEQTFFCALQPDLREKYVQKMKSLLEPNGKIAGLLFQFPLTAQGPPFGGSETEYVNLFSNDFVIETMSPCYNSILPRAGKELFFILKNKTN